MPWKDVNVMELRKQFIRDFKLEVRSVKDLCAMYGISRQTGYNWIERYEQAGLNHVVLAFFAWTDQFDGVLQLMERFAGEVGLQPK